MDWSYGDRRARLVVRSGLRGLVDGGCPGASEGVWVRVQGPAEYTMPQVFRKQRSQSPSGRPSPDPKPNSLTRATMMMAHRSIISVGAKKSPFGSITAEETQILKRTLEDRRRAWAQPGSEPLSKERALAILRRKEKRSVMISELFQFVLTMLVYVSALLMQRPILESHDLESAIESVFVNRPVR
eukprot:COSAG02_NODE_7170_length_3138_cov_113.769231_2_plen_184_part_01